MRLKGNSVLFMKQNGNIEEDGKKDVKLRFCEKATIFLQNHLLRFVLYVVTVKSTLENSQNFAAFSEYMNLSNILTSKFSLEELILS